MKGGSTKGRVWVMMRPARSAVGSNQKCVFSTPAQLCEPALRRPGMITAISVGCFTDPTFPVVRLDETVALVAVEKLNTSCRHLF